MKHFYYLEWQNARKDGDLQYANHCKEKYKDLVMSDIVKPFHFYDVKLRMYPIINLN